MLLHKMLNFGSVCYTFCQALLLSSCLSKNSYCPWLTNWLTNWWFMSQYWIPQPFLILDPHSFRQLFFLNFFQTFFVFYPKKIKHFFFFLQISTKFLTSIGPPRARSLIVPSWYLGSIHEENKNCSPWSDLHDFLRWTVWSLELKNWNQKFTKNFQPWLDFCPPFISHKIKPVFAKLVKPVS